MPAAKNGLQFQGAAAENSSVSTDAHPRLGRRAHVDAGGAAAAADAADCTLAAATTRPIPPAPAAPEQRRLGRLHRRDHNVCASSLSQAMGSIELVRPAMAWLRVRSEASPEDPWRTNNWSLPSNLFIQAQGTSHGLPHTKCANLPTAEAPESSAGSCCRPCLRWCWPLVRFYWANAAARRTAMQPGAPNCCRAARMAATALRWGTLHSRSR